VINDQRDTIITNHLNYQVSPRRPSLFLVRFSLRSPLLDKYNLDVFGPEGLGFVLPFDDRCVGVNQASSSRRDDKREYIETVFYFYSDDGGCYDDDGYGYRFDQDGFHCDTETGYRYGDGRDVRF
jgi:hypothetical protein